MIKPMQSRVISVVFVRLFCWVDELGCAILGLGRKLGEVRLTALIYGVSGGYALWLWFFGVFGLIFSKTGVGYAPCLRQPIREAIYHF